ncbi:MAG TPA: ATP-binding protein [Blastocatellia bacterium]|jgi:serine/threonine-protein kinase RsbW|nr:ATP-binding protein [Blastocatellia bacterium]
MPSIERKFTLKVPSSTENLALIREFVTAVGRQAQLDEPEVSNLELAVDEACANVIEHAYGHDITKEVIVRAKFDDESLRISVIDEGLGFDPGNVNQESVEQLIHDRKSGGLGIRLIKKLMDDVSYEIVPGQKNELHMTMKIRKS